MKILIRSIAESLELLNEVIKLGDANKKNLGFFAEGAFNEVANLGHILVAPTKGSKVLGYLMYRVVKTKNQIAIIHLCVDVKYRNRNIGNKLVERLKRVSKDYYGISLINKRVAWVV